MSLTSEYKLYQVKVEPTLGDKENVVLYVLWGIVFDLDGYTNDALIETILPFDPNADHPDFIPLEDMTKDDIIQRAMTAQGGDQFISQLEYHHNLQLEAEKAKAELIDASLSFNLDPR